MPIAGARRPGRSRALYEEVRARIADGSFAAGSALPSTRALAAERGLSRATVSGVYEQLAADGFIESRAGAASRVAAGAAVPPVRSSADTALLAGQAALAGPLSAIGEHMAGLQFPAPVPPRPGEIDFGYGALSGQDFPTAAWLKALRAVERQRSPRLAYEDPLGNLALRRALQAHLAQTRGLRCALEQLMIVSGSQQALDLCARLLVNPGDRVAVENPGYRIAHHAFEAYGARLLCVDVDAQGLRTAQLAALGPARLAYVTPTHQFPLGAFLPIARRLQLLDWAAQHRAWVIEDDYDSEYRYALRPEATLQSLDTQGRVIHVGTFSKTLSPQLRLGYLVLPPALVQPFAAAKRLSDRHAATGPQRTLARMLEDGSYSRHVRRLRRLQQARQRALVEALQRHLGDQAELQGAAAGLHLVLWLPGLRASQEAALVAAALARGVRVYALGPYFHPHSPAASRERPAGLVMGYALLELERIDVGVRRLAEAVRELKQKAAL
ncbi:MocR-like pyridoxine biosynthesis transcription factor PdxR [Inhella proteolytica]|uniref:PLP-dependent aminotransferase family protein n=1 Tax=Inhella proteolytica TaxID=2795029 RepID=A0A931NI11_9BURK|nr:PLP-dependent aminotransferase family protein [Inhella proteolytica]MBH9577070.1 PLP-dependent aminotransferase family protein [Inhella proteolytica]